MSDLQPYLDQLLANDLSGVTFVRNYLQLQFNPPPMVNIYGACRVIVGREQAAFGEPTFANLAIGQIGKVVAAVSERPEAIRIEFEDRSLIEISLNIEGLPFGEACVVFGREGGVASWP